VTLRGYSAPTCSFPSPIASPFRQRRKAGGQSGHDGNTPTTFPARAGHGTCPRRSGQPGQTAYVRQPAGRGVRARCRRGRRHCSAAHTRGNGMRDAEDSTGNPGHRPAHAGSSRCSPGRWSLTRCALETVLGALATRARPRSATAEKTGGWEESPGTAGSLPCFRHTFSRLLRRVLSPGRPRNTVRILHRAARQERGNVAKALHPAGSQRQHPGSRSVSRFVPGKQSPLRGNTLFSASHL